MKDWLQFILLSLFIVIFCVGMVEVGEYIKYKKIGERWICFMGEGEAQFEIENGRAYAHVKDCIKLKEIFMGDIKC